MQKYFSVILLCLWCNNVHAQEKKPVYTIKENNTESTYTLSGTINMDTGRITLFSRLGDEFYPFDSGRKETSIDHGKFTFTGVLSYPLAYMLKSTSGVDYLSGAFYLEPGNQKIVCNKDSVRVVPKITNRSMEELNGAYNNAFTGYREVALKIHEEQDSIDKIYGRRLPDDLSTRRDQQKEYLKHEFFAVFQAYIKKHPDSYVALSEFGWFLTFRGYAPIYDTVYNQFSIAMKRTVTGKVLKKKLDAARVISIGQIFPDLPLLDTALAPQAVQLKNTTKKYTLVDFWYSHCGPCKSQFPKYKDTYAKYNKNGLEIIGISVDKTGDIGDWKKVITEKGLPWPQYLDKDGKFASSVDIQSCPTNFLLDEHHTIIKKNITPEQLEQIMENTLQK